MIRKTIILLATALVCITASAQKSYQYTYTGKDTLVGDLLYLHKGLVISTNKAIEKEDSIDLYVDSTRSVTFKADLKKVFTPSSVKRDTLFVEDMKSLADPVPENSLARTHINDSLYIIHNGLKDEVDVYQNGAFKQKILKGQGVAFKSKWNELEFVSANHFFTDPGTISTPQAEKKSAKSLWFWLALAALSILLILIIAGVCWYLRKKAKKTKSSPDSNASGIDENAFEYGTNLGDFPFIANKGKKKKKHMLQRVTLPEDKEEAYSYIDKIASFYKDHIRVQERLRERFNNKESNNVTVKLLVKYSDRRPEDSDQWQYLTKYKKWVKYIPLPTKKENKDTIDLWDNAKQDLEELNTLFKNVPENTDMSAQTSGVPAIIGRLFDNLSKLKESSSSQIEERVKQRIVEMVNRGEIFTKDQLQIEIAKIDQKWQLESKKIEEQLKKLDYWKNGCQKEKEEKEKAHNTIVEQKGIIQKMAEESKEYSSRLLFFKSCQPFAKRAVEILDTLSVLKAKCAKMYEDYMNQDGVDVDALCYYVQRADNKLNLALTQVSDYDELCSEIRSLAATGLVTKDKMLHKLLNSSADPQKQQELLKEKLYRDLFYFIAGPAITMADEYAFVLPQYVANGNKTIAKEIGKISSELQEKIGNMGYKLCYARPLTPITNYTDVENCGSKDGTGLPENTILEIKDMALLYGTVRKKTQVTIQQ